MGSSPYFTTRLVLWAGVVLSLFNFSVGEAKEASDQDFFSLIERTPQEVVEDLSKPLSFSVTNDFFTRLPMTAKHRQEFLAALETEGSPKSNQLLRRLLITENKFDAAAKLISPPAHRTPAEEWDGAYLNWKLQQKLELPNGYLESANPVYLADFIACLELPEAESFLQEITTEFPSLEHSQLLVAIERLQPEIKREGGTVQLLRPHLFRLLAEGRDEEALAFVHKHLPDASVPDLISMASQFPGDTSILKQITTVINQSELSLNECQDLLKSIGNPASVYEVWENLTHLQIELIPSLVKSFQKYFSDFPRSSDELKNRIFTALTSVPKSDPRWGLFAAVAEGSDVAVLLEILRAFAPTPDLPVEANSAYHAASKLATLLPAERAEEISTLLSAPGFADLPLNRKIRYLYAGKFDYALVTALADFEPSGDKEFAAGLATYLVSACRNSPSGARLVFAALKPQLKDWLMAGLSFYSDFPQNKFSQSQFAYSLDQLVNTVDASFIGDYRATVAEVVDTLEKSGNQITDVQRWLKSLQQEPPSAARPVAPYNRQGSYPYWVLFTTHFSSPIVLIRFENFRDYQHVTYGLDRFFGAPDPRFQSAPSQTREKLEKLAAKLRRVLDPHRDRTLLYDVSVALNTWHCPDDEVRALVTQRTASLAHSPAPALIIPFSLALFESQLKLPSDFQKNLRQTLHRYPLKEREALNKYYLRSTSLEQYFRGESYRDISKDDALARMKLVRESFLPFSQEGDSASGIPQQPEFASYHQATQKLTQASSLSSPPSEETIAVAKDILYDKIPIPPANRNERSSKYLRGLAAEVLIKAECFESFAEEFVQKLQAENKSSAEILYARLNLYSLPAALRSFPEAHKQISKQLLKADSSDPAILTSQLRLAVAAQNEAKVFGLIRALHEQGAPWINEFSGSNPASILVDKASARRLIDFITALPKPAPVLQWGARPLLDLLVQLAPEESRAFVMWLEVSYLTDSTSTALNWLENAQRQGDSQKIDLALWLVARCAYLDDAREPIRFRASFKSLPSEKILTGSVFSTLRLLKVLEKLAALADEFPDAPGNRFRKLVIRLAADPTPANWKRLTQDYPVDSLPEGRITLATRVAELCKPLNLGPALELAIRSELSSGSLTPSELVKRIELLAKSGQAEELAAAWQAYQSVTNLSGVAQGRVFRLFPDFFVTADEETWESYLARVRSYPSSDLPFGRITRDQFFKAPSARADAMFVDLIKLSDANDGREAGVIKNWLHWFTARSEFDASLLVKAENSLAKTLPQQMRNRSIQAPELHLIDFLAHREAAVNLVFGLNQIAPDEWQIAWTLTANPRAKQEDQVSPLRPPLPEFDGKFDLEIHAGPLATQLTLLRKIEAVDARGRSTIELPDNARFVNIVARSHDGSVTRVSPVMACPQHVLEAVDLSHLGSAARALAWGGPFGGPAWEVSPLPEHEIPLTSFTIYDASPINWSAWVSLENPDDSFAFKFTIRDSSGEILNSRLVNISSGYPWTWNRVTDPMTWMASKLRGPHRVSVSLVAKEVKGYRKPLGTVRLAEMSHRRQVQEKAPAGLKQVGSLTTKITYYGLDSVERYLTIYSSENGFGEMNLHSGEFSGWTSLSVLEDEASSTQITPRVSSIMGRKILFGLRDHWYVADSEHKLVMPLGEIFNEVQDIQLSPTGNAVAAFTKKGLTLITFPIPGTIFEPQILNYSSFVNCAFTADGLKLLATDRNEDFVIDLTKEPPFKPERKLRDPAHPGRSIVKRIGRNYIPQRSCFDEESRVEFAIPSESMPTVPASLSEIKINDKNHIAFPGGELLPTQSGQIFYHSQQGNLYRIEIPLLPGFKK